MVNREISLWFDFLVYLITAGWLRILIQKDLRFINITLVGCLDVCLRQILLNSENLYSAHCCLSCHINYYSELQNNIQHSSKRGKVRNKYWFPGYGRIGSRHVHNEFFSAFSTRLCFQDGLL